MGAHFTRARLQRTRKEKLGISCQKRRPRAPVFHFAHHQDGEVLEEQVETQNEGREEGEVRTEGEGQAGENACFLRGGGKGEARAKRKGSDGARATGSRCPGARKDRGAAG